MNCEQVMDHVQHALDRGQDHLVLPIEAQRHLETCGDCATHVRQLTVIESGLSRLALPVDDQLPSTFHARFMNELRNEPSLTPAQTGGQDVILLASLAAVAILVFTAGLQLLRTDATNRHAETSHATTAEANRRAAAEVVG